MKLRPVSQAKRNGRFASSPSARYRPAMGPQGQNAGRPRAVAWRQASAHDARLPYAGAWRRPYAGGIDPRPAARPKERAPRPLSLGDLMGVPTHDRAGRQRPGPGWRAPAYTIPAGAFAILVLLAPRALKGTAVPAGESFPFDPAPAAAGADGGHASIAARRRNGCPRRVDGEFQPDPSRRQVRKTQAPRCVRVAGAATRRPPLEPADAPFHGAARPCGVHRAGTGPAAFANGRRFC